MCRVLIVDDDKDVQEVLSTVLKKEHSVHSVDNFKAASSINKTFKPNVILLDINLPDAKGSSENVRRIFAPAIVIIITGTSLDDDEKAKLLQTGVFDVINKPFNCAIIAEKVKKAATYQKAIVNIENECKKHTTAILHMEEAQAYFKEATTLLKGLNNRHVGAV